MIGYHNVVHQGWKTAKINRSGVPANPYPTQSTAAFEFELGVRRFQRGETYDGKKKQS